MPARPCTGRMVAPLAAAVLTLGCGALRHPAAPDGAASRPSAAPTAAGVPDGAMIVEEFEDDACGAVTEVVAYWSGVLRACGVGFTPPGRGCVRLP
ncbi:hypothetical protein [Catellatospora sp. NPDC049133]|uniref:hypothetical protein n=1 Tax=Catellatospora sp. NPDC049133 TaxID=3155499 RepID=UPI0033C24E6D